MDKQEFFADLPRILLSCTSMILSKPLPKSGCLEGINNCIKIRIHKVPQKHFLVEFFSARQVFHKNFGVDELREFLKNLPYTEDVLWRQSILTAEQKQYTVLANKRGSRKVVLKKLSQSEKNYMHNRQKNYLIAESSLPPFFKALGLTNTEGKILAKKYDKFRQINRFLEYLNDVLDILTKDGAGKLRPIRILDFGCGKSYLTFALYHFLTEVKGLTADITGIDLKRNVIDNCSALAARYNYSGLHFEVKDIRETLQQATTHTQSCEAPVDMVMSLHACDTATDYAIAFSLKKGARVILCAPCCQHELNTSLTKNCPDKAFNALNSYGIVKERFAALATDVMRAELIKKQAYAVQILEFVDTEHTPKNLLIRAIKHKNIKSSGKTPDEKAYRSRTDSYENLCEALGQRITLEKLIQQK